MIRRYIFAKLSRMWLVLYTWQLRDLHGCYRVCMALTGMLPHSPSNSQVDPVIAILFREDCLLKKAKVDRMAL